jgi:hypothetical protein
MANTRRACTFLPVCAGLSMLAATAVAGTPEAGPRAADKSAIYRPGGAERRSPAVTIPASPGPHLFVDDELIASSRHLVRRVRRPERDASIPNPLVRGKEDGVYQPYFSVSRSPETGRYRIWYGVADEAKSGNRSHVAYMESEDGIHWVRPGRVLKDPGPIQFGSEVIDQGPAFKDPSRRYVLSYWYGGGLRIAVSPDGVSFRPLHDDVLIRHGHDITNVSWDGLRGRYVATVSVVMPSPHFKGERRTTFQSFSTDLSSWLDPWMILRADDSLDEGQTQFYAMNGYLDRGPLRLGMVKVLRDDLFSDSRELLDQRGGGYGTGYTSLAWTRDGEHWVRDREVFFDRGPVGAWDRSHAWIDEQVIVGDQVYLYYAGYRSGHKANRFEDRQIGLVRMPLDRYVARTTEGKGEATLVTVPLRMNGRFKQLLLNASSESGSIRVVVLDGDQPVAGLDLQQCRPVSADGLRLPVLWQDARRTGQLLAGLEGKLLRLEFRIQGASLFAFEFAP